MAKKNKPNARPQEQNAQRNETKPATAPAANKTVAASSTNGANRNRTLVIVLGIIILLILAVVLLALLLTNRNNDGTGSTDNTTSSETTSSEGQVDGTNTTSSEEASSETSSSQSSSETTSSQSSTTTSEEANNGNENNNGQGNEGSNNNTSAPTSYTETAGAGDSVSYLARRAMYKFFQATGNALHTRGQRLFFEVTLTNASNPVAINAGQSRTFSADTMTSILNQAKSLTPAQLSAWENAAVAANYR